MKNREKNRNKHNIRSENKSRRKKIKMRKDTPIPIQKRVEAEKIEDNKQENKFSMRERVYINIYLKR